MSQFSRGIRVETPGFRGEVPSDVSRTTCRIDGGGGAVEPRDDKGLQYVRASGLTGQSRWARI